MDRWSEFAQRNWLWQHVPTLPFTVSHTAAVLPLRRTPLLFSALVVGSMAPDLPHVLLLTKVSQYGHRLPGLFLVSLPVGLAALFIFELLLRRPLLALSPDAVRLRIPADNSFALRPASRIALVLVSLLIGSITHILWDSFTHSPGLLVANLPLLREGTPFWPYRPIYKFLQFLFSIIGLAAIALAYRSWIRNTPLCHMGAVLPVASRVGRIALLVAGTLMISAFGLLYSYLLLRVTPVGIGTFLSNFLFAFMGAGFVVILLFSLCWHLRRERYSPSDLGSGA